MVFASYPFNLNNINMRSDIYLQTRQYDGHRSIFRNGWIGPTICTNTILRFIHPILFKISRKKIIIAIFNYCAACYCKMLRGFQYPTILQPIESIEDKKSLKIIILKHLAVWVIPFISPHHGLLNVFTVLFVSSCLSGGPEPCMERKSPPPC